MLDKFVQIRNFYKQNPIFKYIIILVSLGLLVLAMAPLVMQNQWINRYFDILHLDLLITWPMIFAFIIFYNKMFLKISLFSGIFQGLYFVNLIYSSLMASAFGTFPFVLTLILQLLFLGIAYVFINKYESLVDDTEITSQSPLFAIGFFVIKIVILSFVGRGLYLLLYT